MSGNETELEVRKRPRWKLGDGPEHRHEDEYGDPICVCEAEPMWQEVERKLEASREADESPDR